jgi:CheY-like chemotaxis protein
MRALVVEDEPLIRMHLCDLLEEAGLECGDAANAAQALELLDEGWVPDILITDFNLGPGLTGAALAAEALCRLPRLRVVYITGNPECLARTNRRAADLVLEKPFSPAELLQAVSGKLTKGCCRVALAA